MTRKLSGMCDWQQYSHSRSSGCSFHLPGKWRAVLTNEQKLLWVNACTGLSTPSLAHADHHWLKGSPVSPSFGRVRALAAFQSSYNKNSRCVIKVCRTTAEKTLNDTSGQDQENPQIQADPAFSVLPSPSPPFFHVLCCVSVCAGMSFIGLFGAVCAPPSQG